MKGYGASHVGKIRTTNQDAFFVLNENAGSLPNLYIVADGMGGHLGGDVASKTSIVSFYDYISNNPCPKDNILDFLIEGTKQSNAHVYEKSRNDEKFRGMGTTFTSLCIFNNKGYVTHIGDSRLYLINNNGMKLLTVDHSFVNELVQSGKITPKDALYHPKRHILTRALGTEPYVVVDGFVFDVNPLDRILICTDGLTNMIEEEYIEKVIQTNTIENAVDILVLLANENGGTDNITSILIEIEGDNDVA
ncbi:MAG: Stp1/IreP family PP2C-type Ser/Thr phosphatase [Defluviitaleaceae bacterium]|nr:Stp1/IreP family PP2C-type Ser/Thr phosphatase [Defluviitaleaceae bacterium]